MQKNLVLLISMLFLISSCVSTKNTIKNIDPSAPIPQLNKENIFVVKSISTDPKYGFDQDYPVNVFYKNTNDENLNATRYLNALAGPNGEEIEFTKLESPTCSPSAVVIRPLTSNPNTLNSPSFISVFPSRTVTTVECFSISQLSSK